MERVGIEKAGRNFIAVTDQESRLTHAANTYNFRTFFLNNPDNWVEQLIAESTTKDGIGILPIIGGRYRDQVMTRRAFQKKGCKIIRFLQGADVTEHLNRLMVIV